MRRTSCGGGPCATWSHAQVSYLVVVLLTKWSMNTVRRSLSPYAAELGEPLGNATNAQITYSISAMNLAYTLAPMAIPAILACVAVRNVLVFCLSLTSVCLMLVVLSWSQKSYAMFIVALVGLGAAKGLLDPANLTTMRSVWPTARARGVAVSLVETSWGFSSFAGLPLFGFLLGVAFVAPFILFASLSIATAGVVWIVLAPAPKATPSAPKVGKHGVARASSSAKTVKNVGSKSSTITARSLPEPSPHSPKKNRCRFGSVRSWRAVVASRAFLASALPTAFGCTAVEVAFVSLGLWSKEVHGLDVEGLAILTIFVGCADICAELLVAIIQARRGRLCCVRVQRLYPWTIGFHAFAGLFYALSPALSQRERGVPIGLTPFVVGFFFFEATLVLHMGQCAMYATSGFPDGSLETLQYIMQGLGRILGPPLGELVWRQFGLTGMGIFAASLHLTAALLCSFARGGSDCDDEAADETETAVATAAVVDGGARSRDERFTRRTTEDDDNDLSFI